MRSAESKIHWTYHLLPRNWRSRNCTCWPPCCWPREKRSGRWSTGPMPSGRFCARRLRPAWWSSADCAGDAALRDVPPAPKQRGRGRPRRYGKNRISLAKRAAHRKGWKETECNVYGKIVTKTYKTFLATYAPADHSKALRRLILQNELSTLTSLCPIPRKTLRLAHRLIQLAA